MLSNHPDQSMIIICKKYSPFNLFSFFLTPFHSLFSFSFPFSSRDIKLSVHAWRQLHLNIKLSEVSDQMAQWTSQSSLSLELGRSIRIVETLALKRHYVSLIHSTDWKKKKKKLNYKRSLSWETYNTRV